PERGRDRSRIAHRALFAPSHAIVWRPGGFAGSLPCEAVLSGWRVRLSLTYAAAGVLMQASHTPIPSLSRGRQTAIIASLAFAGLGGSFLHTILIPIQSRLPELLKAEASSTAWVITITLLVSSV